MNKLTPIALALLLSLCCGCSIETLETHLETENPNNLGENQQDSAVLQDENDEDHCVYTNLIAGQHHTAGAVTIDVEGDNLIITYTTNEDWTLGTTHLSIGVCDEDWIPLTGSGNPKIGNFDFTVPFSITPHEVVYIIPITEVGDNYCFAAHAEVEGPAGGETAWGEGNEFSGNSWAMFVEFNLSDCNTDVEHIPS